MKTRYVKYQDTYVRCYVSIMRGSRGGGGGGGGGGG